jgi:hypothetical protein
VVVVPWPVLAPDVEPLVTEAVVLPVDPVAPTLLVPKLVAAPVLPEVPVGTPGRVTTPELQALRRMPERRVLKPMNED